MADKDFEKFLKQQKQGKKDNPITTNKKEPKKKEEPYKSIRIYPGDYKDFKRIAFEQESSIVEMVSEALELLKDQYKN